MKSRGDGASSCLCAEEDIGRAAVLTRRGRSSRRSSYAVHGVRALGEVRRASPFEDASRADQHADRVAQVVGAVVDVRDLGGERLEARSRAVGSAENSRSAACARVRGRLRSVHQRHHLLGERTLGQPEVGRPSCSATTSRGSRRAGGARTSAAARDLVVGRSASSADGTGTGWSWKRRAIPGRPWSCRASSRRPPSGAATRRRGRAHHACAG